VKGGLRFCRELVGGCPPRIFTHCRQRKMRTMTIRIVSERLRSRDRAPVVEIVDVVTAMLADPWVAHMLSREDGPVIDTGTGGLAASPFAPCSVT
jgi:hypothetical protein